MLGAWKYYSVPGCQLSVVSCQLSVVSCQLSVVSCQLSVVSCQLSVVCCQLFVVCCLLFVVCCLLFVVCCNGQRTTNYGPATAYLHQNVATTNSTTVPTTINITYCRIRPVWIERIERARSQVFSANVLTLLSMRKPSPTTETI